MSKTSKIETIVNFRSKSGKTSLHLAIRCEREKIVRLLIDAGTDIHAVDTNDWTPLHEAANMGYENLVQILIEVGSNVDAQKKNGRTALHDAAKTGYENIVRILLEAGAEVDPEDESYLTPLCLAAWRGHADICLTLLSHGADPNKSPYRGFVLMEPLFSAMQNRQVQLAETLIDFGADADYCYRYILEYGYEAEDEPMLQMLRRKLNIESSAGYLALVQNLFCG